jgi:hypothetical protein
MSKTKFITGLPRSRTYWFSKYFNGTHEPMNGCKTRQEFYDKVEGKVNADCGLIITDWDKRWPNSTVIVHRPVDDVIASLSSMITITTHLELFLRAQDKAINFIEGLHVDFSDINDRMKEICTYVGVDFDTKHANKMIKQNLQLDTITGDIDSLLIWREL